MPSQEAIAAAKEIEADHQFGRMEPERIQQRAEIIDRHFLPFANEIVRLKQALNEQVTERRFRDRTHPV